MGRLARMGATVIAALTAVLCAATPAGAAAAGRTQRTVPRAMWLWADRPADDVVAFARRHDVGVIFVNFVPGADLTGTRALARRAAAAGIQLQALGGDPDWVYDRDAALRWGRAADATHLFAGRHVDVEPYLLPGWNTDRQRTATGYLDLLDGLRRAGGSPLEFDVPFWYGQFTVGGRNLADEVLRRVDAVTVMSYRDSATGPNSIMDVSADLRGRARAAGVRTRLAAETQPLTDCRYCTFAYRGRAALADALRSVDQGLAGDPTYRGVAVDHYDSWRALSP